MQLPPRLYAYVSAQDLEVYYYDSDGKHTQWDFPPDYLLANTWKRKLSTDNLEHFVEYGGFQETWHKNPRFRHDPTRAPDTPTNVYEDEEHYDRPKTQHIH